MTKQQEQTIANIRKCLEEGEDVDVVMEEARLF
jgi:hypothetical protein